MEHSHIPYPCLLFQAQPLCRAGLGQEFVTRGQCHISVVASQIPASPSAAALRLERSQRSAGGQEQILWGSCCLHPHHQQRIQQLQPPRLPWDAQSFGLSVPECTLLSAPLHVPVQRLGKGCGSPCPITARTQLDGEWVCSGCRSWITSGGFEVLFFNTKCLSHCVAQNPWRQRCARLCMDRGKILGILRAV